MLLACTSGSDAGERDAALESFHEAGSAVEAGAPADDASRSRDGSITADARSDPDGAGRTGSAGQEIAGLARDFSFAQLDDADAQALCRWQSDQRTLLAPSLREQCTLTAAASTRDEPACMAQIEPCVLAGSLGSAPADCATIRAEGLPTSCQALSAGEYGDCVVAALTAQRARVTSITCADAGHVTPGDSALPAVCASVEQRCSVLLP